MNVNCPEYCMSLQLEYLNKNSAIKFPIENGNLFYYSQAALITALYKKRRNCIG